MSKENILSYNIKYLRKLHKLSQEELAKRLGIKRSNIAAYESKNVEPRLRIVLELAKIFDLSIKSLIGARLQEGKTYPSFNETSIPTKSTNTTIGLKEGENIQEFIEKSIKIRKVLEGFKSFYTFRKNNMQNITPDKEKLIFDIDNFVQLMEHLLAYNETVIKAISNKKKSSVA